MTIIKIQKQQSKETILQHIEKQGVVIESQCRSGFCGACAVKLVSGSVYYPQEPLAFRSQSQILPCVCHFSSSDIEIEF